MRPNFMEDAEEAPPANEPMPPEKQEGEQGGGSTAIIPKSALAGKEFKVGDEIVFKVTADNEDSIEVEYATGEEKPEKGAAQEPPDENQPTYGMEDAV